MKAPNTSRAHSTRATNLYSGQDRKQGYPGSEIGESAILSTSKCKKRGVRYAPGTGDKTSVLTSPGGRSIRPAICFGLGFRCVVRRTSRPGGTSTDHPLGQDRSGLKVNTYASSGGKSTIAERRAKIGRAACR